MLLGVVVIVSSWLRCDRQRLFESEGADDIKE